MKVYDCFTFYNEFELLELRLQSLWDVVDYFVIVEANRKHTGEPKTFNFWERQDEFKDFLPKIRFVPADLSNVSFNGVGDWSIENAQRNAIMHGLIDAQPDDLTLISDLDEIPSPSVFRRLNENRLAITGFYITPPLILKEQISIPAQLLVPAMNFLEVGAIALAQTFHYYYFDWVSRDTWQGTVLVKRKNLPSPQHIRNLRNHLPRVAGGGYHFSYMGGVDRVVEKMTAIVEGNELVEKSGGKFIDKKHVEEAMANGTDIYNREGISESQFCPCDVNNIKLPGLKEFLRKYPHFLREPEKYFRENDNGATDL